MSGEVYDVVVLGGGPGGYPAAIIAAQRGAKTAIVEKDRFGGECTNYGCIPTKALLKGAKLAREMMEYPFVKGDVSIDFKELRRWMDRIVTRSSRGVEYLLKGNEVEIVKGEGRVGDGYVEVDGRRIQYRSLVLATGSKPISIPNFEVDGQIIHNNKTILSIEEPPGKLLVIGGGYIGLEYATLFTRLGTKVTVVELLDRVLPQMDRDLSSYIANRLKKEGVEIRTGVKAESSRKEDGGVRVRLSDGVEEVFDMVLVAVGRKPNTAIFNGFVEMDEKGFVEVDDRMATSRASVYASGDITGNPMLAHKAFMEAVVAGENASGGDAYYISRYVPAVVYTDPELLSVGYTLEEALEKGYKASEEKYPLGGVARARMELGDDGFIKIVYDERDGTILGIHMAAPNASEMAGEATYLLETSATLEDLALTIHPHPTVSEAFREAAEYILDRPIHMLRRRK